MDLVEIRKKAKSRKNQSAKSKDEKGKRGKEKTAVENVPPPAEELLEAVTPEVPPEEYEAAGEGKAADTEPDRNRQADSREGSKEMDENNVFAAGKDEDSLSSLKDVLMSQHEIHREEEEEEQLQLLTFMLGGEEYALNIMDIKEIIRPRESTEVPRAPEYILGIISLRGTIIPIFDVNKRLGLPPGERNAQNRIVVVRSREHLFGLHVDSVVQVMDIPLSRIEPPPEILGGVEGDFLRGVGKIEDRLIILLNLSRILALEEVGAPGQAALTSGRKK